MLVNKNIKNAKKKEVQALNNDFCKSSLVV